jgi:leucine dehydrogenase
MNIQEHKTVKGFEQVIAFRNPAVGLRGFVAIQDTTLGPALGGTRLHAYDSDEEALADALRLSRAMTFKAALAELPCGGGKGVIFLDPAMKRSEAFEAYGEIVEGLGGRFRTGPDVGITEEDLAAIARSTRYVSPASSPAQGDISEHTAVGVWHGMRACLDFAGLRGNTRVAIQGVGSVGLALARILKREGMDLLVADTDVNRPRKAQQELGAQVVGPEAVLGAPCDVLAPCALGGVVTVETARSIQARIVCGSANNVLATPEGGEALAGRGILLGPDYLVNAGGLIRGAEFGLLRRADSGPSLARIYERMHRVLEIAQQRQVSTMRIADELAESRLQEARASRREHPQR